MADPLPRSPELMRPEDTGLLVVDVQQRLLDVQPEPEHTAWNIGRLLDGAEILGIRCSAAEQVPEKLGPTIPLLAKKIEAISPSPIAGKIAFSCGACGELFADWQETGIHRVLICGLETHVCVMQTALDLLAGGFQVLVTVDAVSSRYRIDHETALRRLELSGALLTSTESALFEWCGRAGTAEFKQISKLAKQSPPE
jgi:nicotinamidase-related amidase